MDSSKQIAFQLQRRDPAAWTDLLRDHLQTEEVTVTAVSYTPLSCSLDNQHLRRYFLALADHSDPVTFIGKRASLEEIRFYQQIAPELPHIAPACHFIHHAEGREEGWLVLSDVPGAITPDRWSINDVDHVIEQMATIHATFWRQEESLLAQGFSPLIGDKHYDWQELRQEKAVYFEEGPAAVLSEHAIYHAGKLAPVLLEAANGLAAMRALGGWPGILGETHLTIAADLLDDPVPMLEPLRQLPPTLIHGSPHAYHWLITLFEDSRLVDWQKTAVGPGIFDLVNFLEQFDILYQEKHRHQMTLREEWPVSEETIVDTYILSMSQRLGSQFDGRAARQALPAARCLYVLANWFTAFAEWFQTREHEFNPYQWQVINRRSDAELSGTPFAYIPRYRPYLMRVFQRFLLAYRSL